VESTHDVEGVNPFPIALIAAQLIGANIVRGEQIRDYFTKNELAITQKVRDEKLTDAIKIAKRLVELSAQ
jgi:hypothetical protein